MSLFLHLDFQEKLPSAPPVAARAEASASSLTISLETIPYVVRTTSNRHKSRGDLIAVSHQAVFMGVRHFSSGGLRWGTHNTRGQEFRECSGTSIDRMPKRGEEKGEDT